MTHKNERKLEQDLNKSQKLDKKINSGKKLFDQQLELNEEIQKDLDENIALKERRLAELSKERMETELGVWIDRKLKSDIDEQEKINRKLKLDVDLMEDPKLSKAQQIKAKNDFDHLIKKKRKVDSKIREDRDKKAQNM